MSDSAATTPAKKAVRKSPTKPDVHDAILGVIEDLSKAGMEKDAKNTFHNYSYRSIDGVYGVLSRLFAKHKLFLVPRVLSCTKHDYEVKGTIWFNVQLEIEYTIRAADGSFLTAVVHGEASDNGDKGTNKAMSAAYKYLAFQLFCIPVEGDDADDTVPPVQTVEDRQKRPPKTTEANTKTQRAPTLEELAELSTKLIQAKDDADAAVICRQIAAWAPLIESKDHAKEVCGEAMRRRSDLVTEAAIPSLDKMCNMFVKLGTATKAKALAAKNAARSRLNMDLLK